MHATVLESPVPAPAESSRPARIGPNSVLQTLHAARALEGEAMAEALRVQAGLPDPGGFDGLIPEDWFVSLVSALRAALPAQRAEAVLRDSGARTAAYVARNRIPGPFVTLLGILPSRIGVPLLLSAFRRHAWTFAGSADFSIDGRRALVLDGCPTCRVPTEAPFGGGYYEAAFEGLLHLAAPQLRVRETACRTRGDPACRFELEP